MTTAARMNLVRRETILRAYKQENKPLCVQTVKISFPPNNFGRFVYCPNRERKTRKTMKYKKGSIVEVISDIESPISAAYLKAGTPGRVSGYNELNNEYAVYFFEKGAWFISAGYLRPKTIPEKDE